MRKNECKTKEFHLAKSTIVNTSFGTFEYYRGDFFLLRLAQSAQGYLGDISMKPEWTVCFQFCDNSINFHIWLDNAIVDQYPGLEACKNLRGKLPCISLEIERIIYSFFRTVPASDLADRFLYARVVDLLIQISIEVSEGRWGDQSISKKGDLAARAKALILEDLSTYQAVAALARKIGSSKVELQDAFKKTYGIGVGEFSRQIKMDRACELLEQTNETLQSIALSVGYNDPGNFASAFKKYFSLTPGTFRRLRKGRIFSDSQKIIEKS